MIFQNPQQDGPWPGTRFHFPRKTMTTPGSGFGENALNTNRFGLVGNSSTTVRFPGSVIPAAKSKIFRSRLAKYNLSWSKLKENCPIFFEKDIHSILELIRQQTHKFFWSCKKSVKKWKNKKFPVFFISIHSTTSESTPYTLYGWKNVKKSFCWFSLDLRTIFPAFTGRKSANAGQRSLLSDFARQLAYTWSHMPKRIMKVSHQTTSTGLS